MHLTYSLNQISQELEINGDDLPALLLAAYHQLTDRHPDIQSDTQLITRLADRMLNALSENANAVHLGELAEPDLYTS